MDQEEQHSFPSRLTMKVCILFLLSLSWQTRAHPLIADVLRTASMGGGSTNVDPLYEEANYRFQYEVKDQEAGNDFGHEEVRMGDVATGSFHVMMADGRTQRVDYVADERGYRPIISYV